MNLDEKILWAKATLKDFMEKYKDDMPIAVKAELMHDCALCDEKIKDNNDKETRIKNGSGLKLVLEEYASGAGKITIKRTKTRQKGMLEEAAFRLLKVLANKCIKDTQENKDHIGITTYQEIAKAIPEWKTKDDIKKYRIYEEINAIKNAFGDYSDLLENIRGIGYRLKFPSTHIFIINK